MSMFSRIFDAFSARTNVDAQEHSVPETTRTRVMLYCRDVFANKSDRYRGDYTFEFWQEIYHRLRYRHGRVRLSKTAASEDEDCLHFLMTCRGVEFLDFLEDLFQVDCWSKVSQSPENVVDEVNELLRRDNLPYHLTAFGYQEVEVPLHGQMHRATRVAIYPKVIMRENQVAHSQMIKPVLELLRKPDYQNANQEFLEALEDYRKGDYADCVTKCGSSYESVLKVAFHRKGWAYQQTDTAARLVNEFVKNAGRETFFESVLIPTATLRNRLSRSHGAGVANKNIDRNAALYALHMAASAILFVAREIGDE